MNRHPASPMRMPLKTHCHARGLGILCRRMKAEYKLVSYCHMGVYGKLRYSPASDCIPGAGTGRHGAGASFPDGRKSRGPALSRWHTADGSGRQQVPSGASTAWMPMSFRHRLSSRLTRSSLLCQSWRFYGRAYSALPENCKACRRDGRRAQDITCSDGTWRQSNSHGPGATTSYDCIA